MRAGGSLAVVEESNVEGVNPGEVVQGGMHGGWQEYFVIPASDVVKIPQDSGLPLTAFISVLGFTGPTAYFGFLDIGKPKEGETVVVSAAAGAVGSIVCQIAKLKGCNVVAIAGSDEKCKWIKDDLGADHVINYKKQNILALKNTRIANLLGLAALTLPTGIPSVGFMLMSHANSEEKLLSFGVEIEKILV